MNGQFKKDDFGKNLRAIRENRGELHSVLAREAKVDITTISKWETAILTLEQVIADI